MSLRLSPPSDQEDSRLTIVDHYAFDGDGVTVLVMNTRAPVDETTRHEPFRPGAGYEFKVHRDCGETEDLTYRFTFDDSRDGHQAYTVERIERSEDDETKVSREVILRGRTGAVGNTSDGGQAWAGPAVNPRHNSPRQLHDVRRLMRVGDPEAQLGSRLGELAPESTTGSLVQSLVLTVPIGSHGLTVGRLIGTWTRSVVTSGSGEVRQTGRAGLPLIWSIFGLAGLELSAQPVTTHPADDPVNYGPAIARAVSGAVAWVGSSERPVGYADSVVERILPDLLRYVVGSPAVFGFARFNGRRLSDNVAEVMFSLMTNTAVPTALRSESGPHSQSSFPFVIPRPR